MLVLGADASVANEEMSPFQMLCLRGPARFRQGVLMPAIYGIRAPSSGLGTEAAPGRADIVARGPEQGPGDPVLLGGFGFGCVFQLFQVAWIDDWVVEFKVKY